MILNIFTGNNIQFIAGVNRASTYLENGNVWVKMTFYGKRIDESWPLTGPSFILSDEGRVIDELPYGDIKTWRPRSAKCKEKASHTIKPEIGVNFTGSYVCPEDLEVRKTILEAVNDVLREKGGGERWCLR